MLASAFVDPAATVVALVLLAGACRVSRASASVRRWRCASAFGAEARCRGGGRAAQSVAPDRRKAPPTCEEGAFVRALSDRGWHWWFTPDRRGEQPGVTGPRLLPEVGLQTRVCAHMAAHRALVTKRQGF